MTSKFTLVFLRLGCQQPSDEFWLVGLSGDLCESGVLAAGCCDSVPALLLCIGLNSGVFFPLLSPPSAYNEQIGISYFHSQPKPRSHCSSN